MNEWPVIGSLCWRKDLLDRHGASIASTYINTTEKTKVIYFLATYG